MSEPSSPDDTGAVEHLDVLDEAKRYFGQQIEACRAEGVEPAYPTELLGRMILAMEESRRKTARLLDPTNDPEDLYG